MIDTPNGGAKISLPSLEEPGWERDIPALRGGRASVLINARVQTAAEQLRGLVKAAIEHAATQSGATVSELNVDAFHPGFPRPTHRIV
jgi:hypothetical protein